MVVDSSILSYLYQKDPRLDSSIEEHRRHHRRVVQTPVVDSSTWAARYVCLHHRSVKQVGPSTILEISF